MPYTEYTWITDRLAVGAAPQEPAEMPFDAIVSLSTFAPLWLGEWVRSKQLDYEWCPVVDDFCEDGHEEIVRRFNEAAALIDRCLQDGRRVLVHCLGGISRSATAVIWYFVRYRGYTWEQALELVRVRRPVANPDIAFELPLRLASGEQLSWAWVEQHIQEYVAAYQAMGRTDRGVGLDAACVRAALERQGTLPSGYEVSGGGASVVALEVPHRAPQFSGNDGR